MKSTLVFALFVVLTLGAKHHKHQKSFVQVEEKAELELDKKFLSTNLAPAVNEVLNQDLSSLNDCSQESQNVLLDLMETSTRSLAKIEQLENTNMDHLKDTLNEMDFQGVIVSLKNAIPNNQVQAFSDDLNDSPVFLQKGDTVIASQIYQQNENIEDALTQLNDPMFTSFNGKMKNVMAAGNSFLRQNSDDNALRLKESLDEAATSLENTQTQLNALSETNSHWEEQCQNVQFVYYLDGLHPSTKKATKLVIFQATARRHNDKIINHNHNNDDLFHFNLSATASVFLVNQTQSLIKLQADQIILISPPLFTDLDSQAA